MVDVLKKIVNSVHMKYYLVKQVHYNLQEGRLTFLMESLIADFPDVCVSLKYFDGSTEDPIVLSRAFPDGAYLSGNVKRILESLVKSISLAIRKKLEVNQVEAENVATPF